LLVPFLVEKERKKAEKAQKFAAKQAAKSTAPTTTSKTAQKKKQANEEAPSLPPYEEQTPKGQKKILRPFDDPYTQKYIPAVVESAWYDWWEKEGFFKPEFKEDGKVKDAGAFTIVYPPPNVTGALHMGHALTSALQDCMIRWNRMKGLTTLWLPGCDHAGISTQSVVENMLWRRKNQTKHDLGREKFTQIVWDWKDEYHQKINYVHRKMGASFDWTREAFTMDKNLSAAVTETFVRLHEEGIIYRANRLVNWCVKLNTSLSNLEVDDKELEGRTLLDVPGYERKVEFGVLTYFYYPIDGSDKKILVATTRPETMLGDTGIAVSEKDPRWKHLIGKKAKHPFIEGRLLPIFHDEHVDPEFGSGAVKITPAHDPNDFKIGQRHDLPFINILNDNGTMNANTGSFEGMKRFDARYKVIDGLKEKGLYDRWENNAMTIPLCSKSKDVIEPIIKPQWWMKMVDLAADARKAVESGEIKIRPASAEAEYYRWIRDVHDWCISRQLWWGHQAPAYFVNIEGQNNEDTDDQFWVVARTEEDATAKAKGKFPNAKFSLRRDPDVLDTWFSSGLWPFSTLGWPKKTHDMESLYPTSILETGWDILFFWIARMIMLGIKLTGEVPFTEVYCHSLIRDSDGRKMSKSLGNVIDPLDVMQGVALQTLHDKLLQGNLDPKEVANATRYQKTAFPEGIPECGADALRFTLVTYTTGGGDISFDTRVIHGYRRFANKIYQATRFVSGRLGEDYKPRPSAAKTGEESLSERWILHNLNITAKAVNESLGPRQFSNCTVPIYQYILNQLCDVFIENTKFIFTPEVPEAQHQSAKDTLYTALEQGLCLIHPFMPFVSEELWQRLPRRPGDSTPSITVAAYPQYDPALDDPEAEAAYELILLTSKGIRSLVAEYGLKTPGKVFIQTYDETSYKTASSETISIRSLAGKNVDPDIEILPPPSANADAKPPEGCVVYAVSAKSAVYLRVAGLVDLAAEVKKAKEKLKKAEDNVKKQQGVLEKMGTKVAEAVRIGAEKVLRDTESEVQRYEEAVKELEKLKVG
jgi:valyl-tRNA synthetase